MAPKAKAKAKLSAEEKKVTCGLRRCRTMMCQNVTRTTRSKLCWVCFKDQAARSGARTSGNKHTRAAKKLNGAQTSGNKEIGSSKKAAGARSTGNNRIGSSKKAAGARSTGNSRIGSSKKAAGARSTGNSRIGSSKKAAGARSTGNNRIGVAKKAAGAQSSGNEVSGLVKKFAGKRSGARRSAKVALVVKKHWLDKILAGDKDWEIRGCSTARRGWVHFAESKAGGALMGRARLIDCIRIPRDMFESHIGRHHVAKLADVPYKIIFAWVFADAERFAKPFVYKHSCGAVIWVKV